MLVEDGGEGDFGDLFRGYMFDRLGLAKIVGEADYVRFHAREAMENLSAYTILQLLAQNRSASKRTAFLLGYGLTGLPVT